MVLKLKNRNGRQKAVKWSRIEDEGVSLQDYKRCWILEQMLEVDMGYCKVVEMRTEATVAGWRFWSCWQAKEVVGLAEK